MNFKNINSSSAIFFTTAIFLKLFFNSKFLKNNRHYYVFSFFILFILSFKFINTLKVNFKIDDNLYSSSSIDYFGKRKFIKEDLEYYYEMKKYLCRDNNKIINFTLDSNLVHLCSIKNVSYHPHSYFLKNISPNLYERFSKGELYKNELLITPESPEFIKLKLYYTIKVPKICCSWWAYQWPEKSFYIYLSN
jgi:hypothetical protein